MKSHFTLGVRNLTRRRSRTLLTLLGVVFAIGFTVGLLSISEGFIRSFDVIMGDNGPEIFVMPQGEGDVPFPMQCSTTTIDENIADMIAGLPNVLYSEPATRVMASSSSPTSKGSMMRGMPVIVFGVPMKTFFVLRSGSKLSSGRLPKDSETSAIVVGNKFASNMGAGVGQKITIDGKPFKITGIIDTTDQITDYMGYIPLRTAQKLREQPGKICEVFVKVKNVRKVDDTVKTIKKIFPKQDVRTVDEIISQAKKMMAMTQAVHFGVSCFALIIGVLFVATTMIMSVSERMREFATLRVIGASRAYITKLIITESMILSCLGGLIGFVFGILLSKAINLLINQAFGETFFQTHVSFKLFAIGLAVSVLIGTFAGLVPARMIMKKELAESLRYE